MKIEFSKKIEIKYDVDIFVAGGGSAGVAAAVTAARQGASVFLAESHSCFGGMGTAGFVPLFMEFDDGINFVSDGFGREVYDKVVDIGGVVYGRYLSIPAEGLKRLYDSMVVESGADFTFQTTVISAQTDTNGITYAICNAKSGIFAVKARYFVDCTGDGDLSAMAGAGFEKGDSQGKLMPATLCSMWAGCNHEHIECHNVEKMVQRLEQAFKDGVFTVEDRHHSGMARTGKSLAAANMSHSYNIDSTDERTITRAFIESRSYLPEFEAFYQKYVEGYENVELAGSGSLLGIRESRRIIGDYVLNKDDYFARRKFDDQIGCHSYGVDIHPDSGSKEDYEKSMEYYNTCRYKPGEHYGIPYRSIIVKGFDNLLVAGKCVSADQVIQSSIRIMPGCFVTGQAAGMAAALAAKLDCSTRDLPILMLQNSLASIGAFLGR